MGRPRRKSSESTPRTTAVTPRPSVEAAAANPAAAPNRWNARTWPQYVLSAHNSTANAASTQKAASRKTASALFLERWARTPRSTDHKSPSAAPSRQKARNARRFSAADALINGTGGKGRRASRNRRTPKRPLSPVTVSVPASTSSASMCRFSPRIKSRPPPVAAAIVSSSKLSMRRTPPAFKSVRFSRVRLCGSSRVSSFITESTSLKRISVPFRKRMPAL